MKKSILETDKYPEVTLNVERLRGSIDPSAPSTLNLSGSMVLRGETHPITMPMELRFHGDAVTAAGELVIPYVSWGLKNPSTFILRVSDKVTLHITAVGSVAAAAGK